MEVLLLLLLTGCAPSQADNPALPTSPSVGTPSSPGATAEAAPPDLPVYPWLSSFDPAQRLEARIPPPGGADRVPLEVGGFGAFLRNLPLKPSGSQVLLCTGEPKGDQWSHVAVVDMDVGQRDLQQCADAVIRLRAEWLWSVGRADDVAFHFTSGDLAEYRRWKVGYRAVVAGSRVSWVKSGSAADSHASFRSFLDLVFTYAGTRSLEAELTPLADVSQMRVGDVIIQGGSPGHAVLVVDMAQSRSDPTDRYFLLAQSYMPAQEVHVLVNPRDPSISPWYRLSDFADPFVTPAWTFHGRPLRTWP